MDYPTKWVTSEQMWAELTNCTYYFEYRNGSRLIPPALQEAIRNLFRENGSTADVQFDSYVEDYDW